MNAFSTLVTVRDGKLKLLAKEEFDRGLAQFMDGQELLLSIEEPEQGRTRQQEKFFHGPVLKAFQNLGMGKEEAKAVLCLKFIPKEIHTLEGGIAIVPGSTSKLTKKEYTDLIEQCIQLAAELGEVVQDSDTWLREHRSGRAA